MATAYPAHKIAESQPQGAFLAELRREDGAIGGARFDALLLWGAPPLSLVAILLVALAAALLPHAVGAGVIGAMAAVVAILTYAHLIAVMPRAYGNAEVFRTHRLRLTLVPILVLAALASSPVVLVAGVVLAVFWDVHHSAMQTFGLGRIYDMKAGNDPLALRRVDLLLNAALYIGPAAAGASMLSHFESFARFDAVGWHSLATVPLTVAGDAAIIRGAALLVSALVIGAALLAYARAGAAGYRTSAQKKTLLVSTASVSILAWGFAPPFVAFAAINLFHAIQYFAIVWLKEGPRMRAKPRGRFALPLFLAGCGGFGVAYWLAAGHGPATGTLLAPFIACSLLHFWYDGFVWSVRRKQV
jgi:hypothetical protein